jgi:hypothetical protein
MTLTNVLPSLRRSIPDPLSTDRWPELSVPTTTDVIVGGISLIRLADVCGTPCVHTASAVVPGTHGRRSDRDEASVVVVRVCSVRVDSADGDELHLEATIDADLGRAHAILAEARLIGRASTAPRRHVHLSVTGEAMADPADPDALDAELPCDLCEGDLLVVPCTGTLARRQLLTH